MLDYGIQVNCKNTQIITVRWTAPEKDFALNVDGASKGNPGMAGGGGCFRGPSGQLILGFAYFYGKGSNMVAEGRALLDGLRLAKSHNIKISAIFTDSQVLIGLLKNGKDPPWSLIPWWSALKQLILQINCPIMHTYREGNQLADALANYAVQTGRNTEFDSIKGLPPRARGYALADIRGIPNIRVTAV